MIDCSIKMWSTGLLKIVSEFFVKEGCTFEFEGCTNTQSRQVGMATFNPVLLVEKVSPSVKYHY